MLRKSVIILHMPEDMSITSNTEHADTSKIVTVGHFCCPTSGQVRKL
jgi:hypothetical protein